MASKHTGGKSLKITVALSPELHAAFEKMRKAKRRKMSFSDAVRQALANWAGVPDLAEEVPRGRPRKPDAEQES